MKKIIEDVELDSIEFVNNKNDLLLHYSKNYRAETIWRKKILFENIFATEILYCGIDPEDPTMPYTFIGIHIEDVNLKQIDNNKLPNIANEVINLEVPYENAFIVMASGIELVLNLICERVTELE